MDMENFLSIAGKNYTPRNSILKDGIDSFPNEMKSLFMLPDLPQWDVNRKYTFNDMASSDADIVSLLAVFKNKNPKYINVYLGYDTKFNTCDDYIFALNNYYIVGEYANDEDGEITSEVIYRVGLLKITNAATSKTINVGYCYQTNNRTETGVEYQVVNIDLRVKTILDKVFPHYKFTRYLRECYPTLTTYSKGMIKYCVQKNPKKFLTSFINDVGKNISEDSLVKLFILHKQPYSFMRES